MWTVETANVTTNSSGADYITSEECSADCVLLQELHVQGDAARRAEGWYSRSGWQVVINDATITSSEGPRSREGTSGGTGLAVRRWQGLGLCHGMESASLCKARVSLGHWSAFLPGGILIASVYLVTGEPTGQASLAILEQLGLKLAQWNRPFIVGGDFQMQPREMEATGWPQRLAAAVVSPLQEWPASCSSGRMLDFFAVSADLLPLVKDCSIVQEARTSPHRPVRLQFRMARELPLIRVLKAPKPFPVDVKFGPRRKVSAHWEGVAALLDNFQEPSGNDTHEGLRRCYRSWTEAAEGELCDIHDIGPSEAEGFKGRADDPVLVWTRPQVGSGSPFPKTSADARAWRWTAARIREFKTLALNGPVPGSGAWRHLSHLSYLLRRWKPPGSSPGVESQEVAMAFTSLRGWLRRLSPGCWPGEAEFWASKAAGIADKLDSAHWSLSSRESRRWAQQACKAGAKLAHRWARIQWALSHRPGRCLPTRLWATCWRSGKRSGVA